MRKFLLSFIFSFIILISFAQDFSNKGKDFWVGYGYHQIMTTNNGQEMVLYFATDQVTNITITVPGTGYTQTLASGPLPTVLTSAPIPKQLGPQDVRLRTESTAPENKGIHVTSDKPIVAYAHIYNASVSGASILFPTNTLGKDYFSINYTNTSNTAGSNCWMYVIAADTGTTVVEIIPSVATLNHAAGVPFLVTLTQGQVFNVMATYAGNSGGDLTGSSIKSISVGNVGCKRIAVFSGSGRISITCNGAASSSDNYMVQAFPKSAWGKKYLTASASGSQTNNIYRICIAEANTQVRLNGFPIALPLINNFYYEIAATSEPQKIESDKPILVSQYMTSQGACGNGFANNSSTPGDPEVIYLSPVEQSISKVLWNATPNFNILQHYYNVIIPNTGTAITSFKFDGVPVNPTLFTPHPQDPNYSYLKQNVSGNSHTIESDSGFNAIAYGFGVAESYGYNAGTNVRDLYQRIGVQSQYGIESVPSVCTGSPFKFKISLPYQPDSMYWDFHNPSTNPSITNVMQNGPLTPDSIRIINTRTVYWYSLPGFYTFNTIGTFPITITTYRQNNEGCGNTQEIDFDLEVSNPPIAGISSVNSVCHGQPVQFNDATTSVKPTYTWWWNFGDPGSGSSNVSNLKNPIHTFSAPGTYTVRYANITTPGCLSDTITKTIVVNAIPTATLNSDAVVCLNGTSPVLTFTGIGGVAPYAFSYKLNGGPVTVINSTGTSSVATISVPTTTAGTFTYILTNVSDGSANACSQPQSDTAIVVVGALPSATISGTAALCLNSTSPVITFTGINAAPPYTFTYNINGGPDVTAVASTGNTITVPVATNTAGTFTYNLTNIQSGTSNACSQSQNASATVTINGLPTATIAGSGEACVGTASPTITFTGAAASAPYVFTYNINNGPNLTVTSSGNSATVNVPTSAAGVFVYKLISVSEGSSSACTQAQTGSTTITINALPTADFSFVPACQGRSLSFTDASLPNAGSLTEWAWNFGDAASGSSNFSTLQNPSHIFNAPGTYTVSLSVKTDKGCESIVRTKPVVVNVPPSAGFINPEVCLSDSYAQFTDTSSINGGTITGWIWNFDDPGSGVLNTSTVQNPQHSYSTTGVKNVSLIAISNNGCRDTVIQSFIVNGDVPTANFNIIPSAVCGYDSVHIQNTATVNVGTIIKTEIYWDHTGSPGVFETDLNPFPNKIYAHQYPVLASTRNYSIRYRVYSGLTCVNDIIKIVTVNAVPDIQFNPIPATCLEVAPFLISQATEMGGALPGPPPYFSGPGTNAAGLFNPTVVGPGIHTIQYTFVTSAGCRDSATQQITVLAPPVADFRTTGATCISQALSFESLSTTPAGSLATWAWNFGDGSPVVTQTAAGSLNHTFNAAGTFSVALTITTSDGCKKIINKDVNINAKPVPAFAFPSSICLPNALVGFTNSSSAGTYLWNFGDPGSGLSNTSTGLNPSHIYSTTGPFDVTLQVTSPGGCIHDTLIRINSIHPQPTAAFAMDMPSACVNQAVSFLDQSNPAGGTTTEWHWSFGDGGVSVLENPAYLFPGADTFNVSLYTVNSFGCKSDTLSKPFIVHAYPVVNAGPDVFVLQDGSTTLTPVVTGTNLSYLWSPALYLNNPAIATPVSTPLDDIEYVLTVTAGVGCSTRDSVFVKVLLGPKIPNTFTPNNDGRNDKWVIEYLDTYPNNRVQVFTRTGQLVFESRGYKVPWDGNKNGKSLPIDTYYYIIEPGNGGKTLTGFVTILK